MTCNHCHGTGELYRQDCGAHGLTVPCPSCALIESINAEVDTWVQVTQRGAIKRKLAKLIASARIKRDKDRESPVERPQLEYDHTQEGTANFERALSQVRALENAADLSNSTYAAFMAERDDHLRVLTDLAHQYLSDLRYPPSSDSRERRIERIEAVLREVQP